jgi:hypothetical protein
MESSVRVEVQGDVINLLTPEFEIRFNGLRAFRRFRAWLETARIVGYEAGRPPQTRLSDDGGDEWYALATGNGTVVLHQFTEGEAEMAVTMPAERWREIGHVVLGTSALIK